MDSDSTGTMSEPGAGRVPSPDMAPGVGQVLRNVTIGFKPVVVGNGKAMISGQIDVSSMAGFASLEGRIEAYLHPRDRPPSDPPRKGETPIGASGFKIVRAFGFCSMLATA